MVVTLDVILPELKIDFSQFLTEREATCSLPVFNNNYNEDLVRTEKELNELKVDLEESRTRESEVRKKVGNLSVICEERLKHHELVCSSIKELEFRIKEIEDGKNKDELKSLEASKKILNIYKRLVKLKWLHSSAENLLEAVIFNDTNAFLKYIKFDKVDPLIVEKLWVEIGQACDNDWKSLLTERST